MDKLNMENLKIETERLVLREFLPQDWKRVHEYASRADFTQYQLWGPNTVEDTKKFISQTMATTREIPRTNFELAVCLKENSLLIGGAGFFLVGGLGDLGPLEDGYWAQFSGKNEMEIKMGNIGYAIHYDFQNRGYAVEASLALFDFGFRKLNLDIFYATCDDRNAPSYRVMEKLGMRRVKVAYQVPAKNGNFRNSLYYMITRKEFLGG